MIVTSQLIKLDSESPWGYERKHAALHGMHSYDEALEAFNIMLLKIEKSHDPETSSKCQLSHLECRVLNLFHRISQELCYSTRDNGGHGCDYSRDLEDLSSCAH